MEVILQRFFGRYVSLLSDIPKILKAPCSQIMSFKVHRRLKKNIMKYELKWMYRIQLPSPLSRERTSLIGVPALQFGGALRLVAHLIFFRGVRNVLRLKNWCNWNKESNPWWAYKHNNTNFFTQPTVRTGLLWKIPFYLFHQK